MTNHHSFLKQKNILLGVTGGIAAYKSPDLVRRLREAGAVVRVAMTENAKRFITPLTLQAVSGFPVHDQLFDLQAEAAMGHIELARWADLIVVAPASADFIANLVHGHANDLLSTLCLATRAELVLAPAMNQIMWQNTITQNNLHAEILQNKKIHMLEPGVGSLACGDFGPGRMMDPTDIVQHIHDIFATAALAGINVLITAGPTHEAIDPIRFMTNGSSGKMGYALAQASHEAGAAVTLISGPVQLPRIHNINTQHVVTAEDMRDAVMKQIHDCDIFMAVAAVSDYRCEKSASHKIHKTDPEMVLKLVRNPDIVAEVGQLKNKPFIVGFAAETENLVQQAKQKRSNKHMDIIIANEISKDKNIGMGGDDNAVTVITNHHEIVFPATLKSKLARELIVLIAEEFKKDRK